MDSPKVPLEPSIPKIAITDVDVSLSQPSNEAENISDKTFCKLTLSATLPDGYNTELRVVLDKISASLEKKIDGNDDVVYGVQIKPYLKTNKFSGRPDVSLAAITHIITEIFKIFSIEPNKTLTDKDKLLEVLLKTNFKGAKLEFIVFRDTTIKINSLADIDQRSEINKAFTPYPERGVIVAKGNLAFDREFFAKTQIALYYDITLQSDISKLENSLLALYPGQEDKATPKEESKSLLSFKEFSNKLLPESVSSDVVEIFKKKVEAGLEAIAYNPKEGTVFDPPVTLDFPIKWDSLKNKEVDKVNEILFGKVFNSPEFVVSIDGTTVTVTPSTFTFTLS